MEDSMLNDKADGQSAVASPAETVHAHDLSENTGGVTAKPGTKVCCVCGKNVAHEERFKDKMGRYWCYECGVADSHKRHGTDSVKCPDCAQPFPQKDLVEFEGHHFCAACAKKRTVAAKREAARKAAALEAEEHSRRQWKMMIMGSVAFAIVAVVLVLWVILK